MEQVKVKALRFNSHMQLRVWSTFSLFGFIKALHGMDFKEKRERDKKHAEKRTKKSPKKAGAY